MKIKYLLLLFALTGFNIQTKAQNQADSSNNTYDFSIDECIEYAKQNQASIKNARLDQDIAKQRVRETTSIGLPQINGDFSFDDYLKIPITLVPAEFFGGEAGQFAPVQFGVKFQSSAGVSLSQLLFDGSYLVGLKAAKTFKELSNRNLNRSVVETEVAVRKAYYSVLVNNERLNIIDANLNRLNKSLKETEELFKNGFAEKIDADRLKVLYNNSLTEKDNVIRLLAVNVDLLKFQIGMPIEATLTLKDKIADVNLPAETTSVDTGVYRLRPEFLLIETQRKLDVLDWKRYKAAYLPQLSASASYVKNFQANVFRDLYDQAFDISIIGLKLNVPIFSSGQRDSRVQQAKLAIRKTDNNIIELKNSIKLDVNQSGTNYANGLKSLENQKRNRELAAEILRVTKVKYEQGIGSSLEVTTAETSLKEAENNYINALYDALINKVNLDKSLGRIKQQ